MSPSPANTLNNTPSLATMFGKPYNPILAGPSSVPKAPAPAAPSGSSLFGNTPMPSGSGTTGTSGLSNPNGSPNVSTSLFGSSLPYSAGTTGTSGLSTPNGMSSNVIPGNQPSTVVSGTDPATGRVIPSGSAGTLPQTTTGSTAPTTPNLPGPPGSTQVASSWAGNRSPNWAADYDPNKGGFQWSDGTMHGVPQAAQGTPTILDPTTGKQVPNPNYVPAGPTTDVWGNALGSKLWGQNNGGVVNNAPVSPFGPNPFITNAGYTAPGGFSGGYNPLYFATQQTANTAAQMIPGAKVIQQNAITNAPGSQIMQNQPNWMLQLPNGQVINPGFLADAFNHGYPQQYINQLLSSEVNGGPNFLNSNSLDPIYGPYSFSQDGKISTQAQNSNGSYNPTTSFTSPYNPQAQSLQPATIGGGGNTGAGTGTTPTTTPTTSPTAPIAGSLDPALSQILSLFTGIGTPSNNPFSQILQNSGVNTLGNGNNSLGDIASLLTLFNNLRSGSGGVLNPLFWNSGGQVNKGSLYPSFY